MVAELPEIALNGFYNQTQVARILGVSYSSVHRWIQEQDGLRVMYNKRTGYPLVRGREIVRFFNSRI